MGMITAAVDLPSILLDPRPSVGHIFFIFMQFSGKFWLNNSLAYPSWGGTPLEILDPPCTIP